MCLKILEVTLNSEADIRVNLVVMNVLLEVKKIELITVKLWLRP